MYHSGGRASGYLPSGNLIAWSLALLVCTGKILNPELPEYVSMVGKVFRQAIKSGRLLYKYQAIFPQMIQFELYSLILNLT